ncbi:helix-turn-helix transcriptional regulator [Burkholderia sp. F1]|uniref:helix-turn-helix transcriptional regulator n=1 Tax=Burkholderia sp. F1 TaxID=3366817 RepID=UPI003D763797
MQHVNFLEPARVPERLIPASEVIARTCLSKSEVYRRMAAGQFPQNVKVGARAVAWREAEIDAWIRGLIDQQRGAGSGVAHG